MNYRITDLLNRYRMELRSSGYSLHTIERVELTLGMLQRDMNIKNLDELTTDLVLEWGTMKRDGVFGKPLSQSGLYANYNSVRSFAKFLDSNDITHPLNRKRIHCKPDYKERKCLNATDVRKIVPYATYDIGVLIRLLFTGGMRIGEAINLTSDDLRHDYTIQLDHSKWCNSRIVLITAQLHSELQMLAPEGGYIFRDRKDPRRPINRKSAYYYVKQAMIKAGYENYYPHAERHGYATELLRNGAGMSHVRRMMGHKNITTTQIYEHLVVDDLRTTHTQYLPVV